MRKPSGEGDVGEYMDSRFHRADLHPDESIDEYLGGIKKAVDKSIENFHHPERPEYGGGTVTGHMDKHLIQRRLGTVLRNAPTTGADDMQMQALRARRAAKTVRD